LALLRQISSQPVHTVTTAGRKTTEILRKWQNFELWGILYPPHLPFVAKFSMREWGHGILCHAKFHLTYLVYAVAPAEQKNTILSKCWIFWIFCNHPCTNQGQIWYVRVDPWYILPCHISLGSISCVAVRDEKPPPCKAETKLNVGAQLQTFPYPLVSKSFLTLNGLMVITHSHTLLFMSMKDKKANKKS